MGEGVSHCPVPAGGVAAYVDESYGPGMVYVLAAVLVRETRMNAARTLADLAVPVEVAVRTGEVRTERARGQCWASLLWQLHGRVDNLVVEARSPRENTLDSRTIAGSRPTCCGPMDYSFVAGRAEALLWAADTVAGAVFQERARGKGDYLAEVAKGRLSVVDL